MCHMFNGCKNLEYLDISSFDTTQVLFMEGMFYECSSLTSLNLSHFNTENVINMNSMFGKLKLSSLDLSNFKTSKVTDMGNMFDSCVNLEYINLNNFDENKLENNDLMFFGVPEFLVICINESITSQKIMLQLRNVKCNIIDCSNNLKPKKKIITKTNNYFNFYEDCNYNYFFDKNEISKEEEIKFYDNMLKIIEEEFTSIDYNTSYLDNGEDEYIETEKLIIALTTTENQRNNINNNITKINLGECELLLRKFYNISSNEPLYIKKIDIIQEGMNTLKVEYDIYAKLFGKNLINLNLTVCEQSKISISIPIKLTEEIDKLNSSSGYYNDICYTTTSGDGTDISLKDRQKEYINKDRIVCQEDCDFSEYNSSILVAEFTCIVKECEESFSNMNINKVKILENFKNIKNFINFNFLICYKKLFNKEGILNNVGSYIILSIILFHIITIFIFSLNQFPSLVNKIKDIFSDKVKSHPIKKNKKEKPKTNKRNKIYIHKNDNKKEKGNKNIYNKKPSEENRLKIKSKSDNNNKENININKYIDEEINEVSYNLAMQYDKRTFFQYYISLIKTQHILISSFCNNNDYNSGIIKINLFLIGFAIEYTVNALFFNDETMHKIYESKGNFDFETQIPNAVYSTLISLILNYPLNFLALTNNIIIEFKHEGKKNVRNIKNLKNKLIIKFILYFIISFLFLLFFWYYISMFGVIYNNTQYHLLKDFLMSFGLSLIFPFFIYLLPGIFRIPALSNINKKRECLYNFSKLLHSI